MKRSCPYCGLMHDQGAACSKKPKPAYGKHKSKAGDFRKKNIWTRKSKEIRDRDLYCCRYCLSQNIITTRDLSVHHIVPINEDERLKLENDNLITLCNEHHEQAEQGEISRETLRELARTEAKISPHPKRR